MFLPADEYKIPGYKRVSRKASLLHWTDAPVTMIFLTPVAGRNVYLIKIFNF